MPKKAKTNEERPVRPYLFERFISFLTAAAPIVVALILTRKKK